jgi:hypothetical protein
MHSDDEQWARVWAEMSEPELRDTLRSYMWLAANTPNDHAGRIQQLKAECERRGKADLVESVQAWVSEHTGRSLKP